MRYEKGLERLKRHLQRIGREDSIRRVKELGARLHKLSTSRATDPSDADSSNDPKHVLDELDKIAYRALGESFDSLCSPLHSSSGDPPSSSLRSVLRSVLAFFIVPAVGIAMTLSEIQTIAQERIKQTQMEIEAVYERTNEGLEPPYENDKAIQTRPCSERARQTTGITSDLDIRFISGATPGDCTWQYLDESGQTLAEDIWDATYYRDEGGQGKHYYYVEMRKYYDNGRVVAQDSFNPQSEDCFRHRQHFDKQGRVFIKECFSERGLPHSKSCRILGRFIELRNDMRSTSPPMFRFFYR